MILGVGAECGRDDKAFCGVIAADGLGCPVHPVPLDSRVFGLRHEEEIVSRGEIVSVRNIDGGTDSGNAVDPVQDCGDIVAVCHLHLLVGCAGAQEREFQLRPALLLQVIAMRLPPRADLGP